MGGLLCKSEGIPKREFFSLLLFFLYSPPLSRGQHQNTQLWKLLLTLLAQDFLVCSVVKESAYHCRRQGDARSIPGSGRLPGGGNDNPLQYFCLKKKKIYGLRSLAGCSPWGRKEADVTECTHTFPAQIDISPTHFTSETIQSPFHSCTHCLNS